MENKEPDKPNGPRKFHKKAWPTFLEETSPPEPMPRLSKARAARIKRTLRAKGVLMVGGSALTTAAAGEKFADTLPPRRPTIAPKEP